MTAENGLEGCRCEEALEHLYEYLDAEMSEIELGRLRAHIDECNTCLDEVSRERELRIVLKRSCAEVAPDALRMRVRTQLTILRQSRSV
ncbi:mycothiol system anti-sigma-R factor [Ruania zhangjianzhongii]|uniref:mycothiol system anti-sigma-R factor n=1 Tax=Ruania zhangjianzhongii TaxID=2603206 RepID=UPI0011C70849|nr:mycothiol system anti-sigma-R factor [Ruania zhangjianzhongii]